MNLFYQKSLTEGSHLVSFETEESRHIAKVLRHKIGDIVHITNGNGILFTAQLQEVSPKRCQASILHFEIKAPLPYHVHLAVAPTKNIDRFEWFLEKATEIGISEITPIICEHSERKVIKGERLEKIIESAMKQSLKMHKPKLNPITSFSEFSKLSETFTVKKMIAHCAEFPKTLLKNALKPSEDCLILIGPEGDFSAKEIEWASKNNFLAITLGESRLRTETAALVACFSISYMNLK
ncbi:MAG: 16S rRNA (uracil(1498)-N(3))-methyltransferase [Flavobacteriaceae bacterium]